MNTTVYIVRHSKPLKLNNELNYDNLQLTNEKSILSIEGEQIAFNRFNNKEFENIDIVFSSNYVRAISTAKYVADKNNLVINVISNLGERKHGVESYSDLPADFELKQFEDENFKVGNGESSREVQTRMYNCLMKILEEHKGKKIVVVSHSTALTYLIKMWCEIKFCDEYKFNNEVFFDGNWNYCEAFKLIFDENNKLLEIINLD